MNYNSIPLTHPTCFQLGVQFLGKGIKKGVEFYFRCPQHNDKTPSLRVNRDKNCWFCDPCNKGGGWWKLAAFIAGLNHKDKRSVSKFLQQKGM